MIARSSPWPFSDGGTRYGLPIIAKLRSLALKYPPWQGRGGGTVGRKFEGQARVYSLILRPLRGVAYD